MADTGSIKMQKLNLNHCAVASSETARDINRRIVLNLVRQHQPVSRAGLARYSGMQRSTVSAITDQLISERWVVEGAVGHLPRGRKPVFLHLNPDRAAIIGVDIRPAVTNLAVASTDMRILARESIPTTGDPQQFIELLGHRINGLVRTHPGNAYEGIGISLPGRVDSTSQLLTFAPNLDWRNVDFKTPLEQITGLRVELDNAANACALAELWSGRHGERVSNLIAVTVSEGIGVGMIMNGRLLRGSQGLAGEFGHIPLKADGPECRCGNYGCWELLASNAAAVRYYGAGPVIRKPARLDGPALSFNDLMRLAEQGDAKAARALEQMGHYLGLGLAMLATGLAPDVLVVVGEVTRVWNQVGPVVEHVVQRHSFTHSPTRILAANSEGFPRLRGAITLVAYKPFTLPA